MTRTIQDRRRPVDDELRQMLAPYHVDRGACLPIQVAPAYRLATSDPSSLTDGEILLALLEAPDKPLTAEHHRRTQQALDRLGGLAGLRRTHLEGLVSELGIAQAVRLKAAIELATRFARSDLELPKLLHHPYLVAEYLLLRYGDCDQEVMGALFLDGRSRLIEEQLLFRGTSERLSADRRVILRQALLLGAEYVILYHNHPAGDPTPSIEDLHFTHQLHKACRIVNLRLVDHIIVSGENRWVSLKNRGGLTEEGEGGGGLGSERDPVGSRVFQEGD